ncbi:MAG TPA: asparagine--tRNA ligase [Spirochaetota bacterium]|nr:asparagine--tRNA ligase [Spirochaetota bacterium]HPP05015.1 asparagine--tRNA ligase [Spirochaetota bacterium]
MRTLSIKEILKLEPKNQGINVKGWIRTKREAKDFCFLEINDGSTIKSLQIIIDSQLPDYKQKISILNTGASISINGRVVPSQGKNQRIELIANEIHIYGDANPLEYPLQKKKHSFEFLREIAHLRPRTNTFGAIARLRSELSYAIHTFFKDRGFFYIHTPLITSSDCEGAGEMFRVTTLDLEKLPFLDGKVDYLKDFFGKETFLTVSGQLNGEAYACALSKIYTFGPTFRAEHSSTTRHLAEFWMIEPEMAFCDINDNMDIAEEFLKYLFNYVLKNCRDDLEFFNERIDNTVISNLENIVKEKFERITYTEAINILKESKKKFEYPVEWGVNLQAEHERFLTEIVFKKPIIVTDYPKDIKAFYMKLNDDNKTVRAMDVLVPKLGEIIGGSEREENYDKLLKRIKELGLKEENYWWYLELRKFGTVPHSGFGLGFERLIQYISGMQNIRDVIPFPRTYKSINF